MKTNFFFLVELQSLLGNQLFVIKWGQGKPERGVEIPPFDGSKLLTKLTTVSWKKSNFLYAIQSNCKGTSFVLHTIFCLPSVRNNHCMTTRWTCLTKSSHRKLRNHLDDFCKIRLLNQLQNDRLLDQPQMTENECLHSKGVEEGGHPVWWQCKFARLSIVWNYKLGCSTTAADTGLSCLNSTYVHGHTIQKLSSVLIVFTCISFPKRAPLMIIWAPIMLQTWVWEYTDLDLCGSGCHWTVSSRT